MKLRRAFGAFVISAAVTGCQLILGITDRSAGARACQADAQCPAGSLCLFGACAARCEKDIDCPPRSRCLKTDAGAACVVSSRPTCEAVEDCPRGTACTNGACRTPCSAASAGDCLVGQTCSPNNVCIGTDPKHDPEVGSAGDGGSGGGGAAGRAGNEAEGGEGGEATGTGGNAGAITSAGSGGVAAGAGGRSGGSPDTGGLGGLPMSAGGASPAGGTAGSGMAGGGVSGAGGGSAAGGGASGTGGNAGGGGSSVGPPNVAFVTSTVYTGAFGGLAGADAACEARAIAAGLTGTFVALLGTTTSEPIERLGSARGWVRVDGKPFADTAADVAAGRVLYPLVLDEWGVKAAVGSFAFTGATVDSTCGDWQLSGFDWTLGSPLGEGGSEWLASLGAYCAGPARLYCFGIDRTSSVQPPAVTGRRVFVTGAPFNPNSGPSAADALCNAEAVGVGLPAVFKAYLATPAGAPASRFDLAGSAWQRLDGVAVVATAADLALGKLEAPINRRSGLQVVSNQVNVWTGSTEPSEVGVEHCAGWTRSTADENGRYGRATAMGPTAFSLDSVRCNAGQANLYCFEDQSSGTVLPPPPDSTPNKMFVTSTNYDGDLGGLVGADAICAGRAQAAGLTGTFVAWLATGTVSFSDRLGNARGWVRTDGLPVANTKGELFAGRLLYPPVLDEFGAFSIGTVATGVEAGPRAERNCNDWTDNASSEGFAAGWTSISGASFYAGAANICSSPFQIYCMETTRRSNVVAAPPPGSRLAFVSRATFVPGGGIAAADALCDTEAQSAGLSGSFRALLATSSASALSRFGSGGPAWARPDGVVVAMTGADLAQGSFLSKITVTADGVEYPDYSDGVVMVGADRLDAPSGTTCADWMSTAGVTVGLWMTGSAPAWPQNGAGWGRQSLSCTGAGSRIYCLEE